MRLTLPRSNKPAQNHLITYLEGFSCHGATKLVHLWYLFTSFILSIAVSCCVVGRLLLLSKMYIITRGLCSPGHPTGHAPVGAGWPVASWVLAFTQRQQQRYDTSLKPCTPLPLHCLLWTMSGWLLVRGGAACSGELLLGTMGKGPHFQRPFKLYQQFLGYSLA